MNIGDKVLHYAARRGDEIRRPEAATVTAVYPPMDMQAFSPGTWVRNAVHLDLKTEDGVLHENVPCAAEAGSGAIDGEYWQERFS